MANVIQISLESLLLRATNPNNPCMDTAAVNAFFALINKERDGASLGVKVIASRLPLGCEKEVLSMLNILDNCMSKCGTAFQNEVGKFRFLNEMIKLVSPKYLGSKTPLSVKQKVLQLLYLWTLDYPKELKIKEAYDMLRKQGVIKEIPNPNVPQEALGAECKKKLNNSIFHDEEKSNILKKLLQSKDPEDIQAANWLIKSMVKEDEKLADLKSKTLSDLESVQNNIKLLNEMMGSYKDGDTTKNELDLMSELHDNLVRFKPNLKSMASTEENSTDLLETVLKTMDDVTECSNRYNLEIVHCKSEDSKSNLASLLELDQQSVGPRSVSLIRTDFYLDSKSSTDDCSCSSHNGSSQTSHVSSSSTTSKSSMDVLCDVFSGLGDGPESADILQPVAVSKVETVTDKGKNAKIKALEDLDVLSEHLLKDNLLSSSSNRNQEKIPMNLLTKINEIKKQQQNEALQTTESASSNLDLQCLLESRQSLNDADNLSQIDNTDDCLVDISGDEPVTEESKSCIAPVKLKDISIRLEDIKPSSKKSIVALNEKNGLSVLLHRASGTPWPQVSVYVVTTISRNELSLSNYLFQAVVPKGCKLRLLSPSSTDLPAFNAFLPPAAITQIMLIANESSMNDINLKFIISYVMDDDTVTEMGEVQDLPL